MHTHNACYGSIYMKKKKKKEKKKECSTNVFGCVVLFSAYRVRMSVIQYWIRRTTAVVSSGGKRKTQERNHNNAFSCIIFELQNGILLFIFVLLCDLSFGVQTVRHVRQCLRYKKYGQVQNENHRFHLGGLMTVIQSKKIQINEIGRQLGQTSSVWRSKL